jgi:cell fate regulator YaaT (PSP1 superfamily)
MCCLKYEQDAYEYLWGFTPRVGWSVKTQSGDGVVIDSNPITGALLVRLNDSDAAPIKVMREEVKVLRKSKQPKVEENPVEIEE